MHLIFDNVYFACASIQFEDLSSQHNKIIKHGNKSTREPSLHTMKLSRNC